MHNLRWCHWLSVNAGSQFFFLSDCLRLFQSCLSRVRCALFGYLIDFVGGWYISERRMDIFFERQWYVSSSSWVASSWIAVCGVRDIEAAPVGLREHTWYWLIQREGAGERPPLRVDTGALPVHGVLVVRAFVLASVGPGSTKYIQKWAVHIYMYI